MTSGARSQVWTRCSTSTPTIRPRLHCESAWNLDNRHLSPAPAACRPVQDLPCERVPARYADRAHAHRGVRRASGLEGVLPLWCGECGAPRLGPVDPNCLMPLYLFRMMRKLRHGSLRALAGPVTTKPATGFDLGISLSALGRSDGRQIRGCHRGFCDRVFRASCRLPREARTLSETIGPGVALGDYENDGWLEIHFVNALSDEARKGTGFPEPGRLVSQQSGWIVHGRDGPGRAANHRGGRGGRLRGRHR